MAATSHYFRAVLGQLDAATEKRLSEWADANCTAHHVARTQSGEIAFCAQRPDAKTSKSHKMTLRTVWQNWGMALPVLGSEWLQLLTPEQFEAAAPGAGQRPATAPPSGVGGRSADRATEPHAQCRLPADFDTRALAAWRALQERRAVACAA